MWLYLIKWIFGLFFVRVLYLMYMTCKSRRNNQPMRQQNDPIKTVIVIGSGGHTTEMLNLVQSLKPTRYSPRIYIMASSDSWSENKIIDCEKKFKSRGVDSEYSIIKIPRSRSVHQSYLTSILTSFYSILITLPIMLWHNPDLVLCNGPGTCIPVCFVAFIMRCLCISNNVIIFVESVCRVWSLSLTGKILHFFADEILVQWPELVSKCSKAKYLGRA